MGSFKSGTWIVGLLLYFFAIFVVTSSYLSASYNYDLDTSGIDVSDPGFQNQLDTMDDDGFCSGGRPFAFSYCYANNAEDNASCSLVGCTWDGNSCEGTPSLNPAFNDECSRLMNSTVCFIMDCTWIDYSSQTAEQRDTTSKVSMGTWKNTIAFMSGFEVDVGEPSSIRYITRFIFFYIPFIMLLWAIYMALPFAH